MAAWIQAGYAAIPEINDSSLQADAQVGLDKANTESQAGYAALASDDASQGNYLSTSECITLGFSGIDIVTSLTVISDYAQVPALFSLDQLNQAVNEIGGAASNAAHKAANAFLILMSGLLKGLWPWLLVIGVGIGLFFWAKGRLVKAVL